MPGHHKFNSIIQLFTIFISWFCFALQISYGQQDSSVKIKDLHIQDFAQLLNEEDYQRLSKKLKDYEKESSNRIVIALVNSIKHHSNFEYAEAWAKKVGIKKNGKNGVFVLIDIDGHYPIVNIICELKFKVSYIITNYIENKNITPNFKKKQYAQGIELAVNEFKKLIAGDYNNDKRFESEFYRLNKKWYQPSFALISSVFVMLCFIIAVNFIYRKNLIEWKGIKTKIEVIYLFNLLAITFSIIIGNEIEIDKSTKFLILIISYAVFTIYLYLTLELLFNSKLFLRVFVFISFLTGQIIYGAEKVKNSDNPFYVYEVFFITAVLSPFLSFIASGVIKFFMIILRRKNKV